MNGEVKATANVTIKPSDFKPNKNYIGKSQFADPLFNGLIDEFRVYNRALSADEIKAVYNKSSFDSNLYQAQKIIDNGQQYYSDETWNKLLDVYGRAKALRADPSATQAALDAMAARIACCHSGTCRALANVHQ